MSLTPAVSAWAEAEITTRIRTVAAATSGEKGLDADALRRFQEVLKNLPATGAGVGRPTGREHAEGLAYYDEFVLPFFEGEVLLAALKTGKQQWDPFADYGRDPAKLKRFMSWMDRRNALEVPHAARALTLGAGARILDVGGGGGALAAALKDIRNEAGDDVVGDIDIYELPEALPVLQDIFVAHHGKVRGVRYVGGSFLTAGPTLAGLGGASYDLAVLSWVLHDWSDDDALAILSRTRRHLAPGGQVAVIELLRDAPGAAGSGFLDLLMLLHTGGRERSFAEYRSLLAAAGFREIRHRPIPGRRQLVLASG